MAYGGHAPLDAKTPIDTNPGAAQVDGRWLSRRVEGVYPFALEMGEEAADSAFRAGFASGTHPFVA